MKSASLCPRAPMMKNNQATVESGKAFLHPTRQWHHLLHTCTSIHAYSNRGGREEIHFFSPGWCAMQKLQRNKLNPCIKEESTQRGDIMQNVQSLQFKISKRRALDCINGRSHFYTAPKPSRLWSERNDQAPPEGAGGCMKTTVTNFCI